MCDKLRTPRRPPSIFGARRGEIQDDLDPVSISAPTSWCASVVPCSVTAAMLTSRFGPICSIALGSKEMDRRCQLPFRASGSSSSLMAVRYTEPIRTLGRSTLAASTKSLGDRVEIRIRDNGTGIPPDVKEKMFNPFFTTKPAGEGTGLGLSISHDIIVKQHGGSIEVDTQPGEFTEIKIILPRAAVFVTESGGRA